MKKLSFLSALCAVMAMMLTSCTGNEELLQSMVGTWTDNDAEETVTIQFYPSTDGHTGKFIERRSYVMDGEDSDGIEMNIRCNTYITGTFTLTDERRLTYEYDLDKLTVMPEDEDMAGYTQRNIEYNNSHDNVFQFAGTEDAEVQEHLTNVLASGANKHGMRKIGLSTTGRPKTKGSNTLKNINGKPNLAAPRHDSCREKTKIAMERAMICTKPTRKNVSVKIFSTMPVWLAA